MIDLLDELKLEDLDGDQYDLAKCLGMESYIKLVRTFSGSPINVPMPDTITLKLRNKKIREERNKHSVRELALKYGVSKRTVYDICSYKSKKSLLPQ